MRNNHQGPRQEGELGVMFSQHELHFVYTLLTQLKADDLVQEDRRRRAIEWLEPMWLLARDATTSGLPSRSATSRNQKK